MDGEDVSEENHRKISCSFFMEDSSDDISTTDKEEEVIVDDDLGERRRGHRVMVVSPRYMCGGPSDKKFVATVDHDCRIKVSCSGGSNLPISLFSN
ncbi:hypothetical protein L6452_01191 [Arctium lappa]|uniref:Uncharacterized protein n=1 Tax=Arctium lappa TaxID=4217 RepID=A0ACB9FG08_ARCLA|nr:hypothetical protein L6452_01191 [Arctium lappa]